MSLSDFGPGRLSAIALAFTGLLAAIFIAAPASRNMSRPSR